MAEDEPEKAGATMDDIFGDSDSDEELEVESQEKPAPAPAKKAEPAAADSDSDDDLALSSDEDDDADARLAALVKQQKKKPSKKKAKPKADKPKKERKAPAKRASKKIPKKSGSDSKKRKADDESDAAGVETDADREFVEKGSDDDEDDDERIKTKGGWTEDKDIEGSEEETDPSDKRWLDKMWGRNKAKKREKGHEEYKTMALNFKQKMDDAQDEDEAANRRSEPALERLTMIPQVRTEMRKHELQHLFLDECGILLTFKRWLAPLNGKAFPNFNLKNGVFEILDEMTDPEKGGRAVNPDQVRDSGIGGLIMLYKTKDKNPAIRNIAAKIIDRWARPVLGVGSNSMKRLQEVARETKDGRKFTKIAAKRETKAKDLTTKVNKDANKMDEWLKDRATNAKLGQPGFVFHAGWPVPGQKNYSKNVTQDRRLMQLEKDLEDRNDSLEDYLKAKKAPRAMDQTMNRTTGNNKRRRQQAIKNVIDCRSVCD